jgi:hypothetical protein
MNQFVRPVNIPSPISGQPVAPRLVENDLPDKVVVEAHWIDPQSGAFIRKGIVEIREKYDMNEDLKNEIESVVESLAEIVESGDAPVESIVHFVESETRDIARRNPGVGESFIKSKIEEGLKEIGIY